MDGLGVDDADAAGAAAHEGAEFGEVFQGENNVGVFGDDNRHASELNWTLQQCRNSSREMNRDFVWHKMETGATENFVWLKAHLSHFLSRKHSRTEKSLIAGLPAELTPLSAVPVLPS